jgi:putative heme-binding domain-containing protein
MKTGPEPRPFRVFEKPVRAFFAFLVVLLAPGAHAADPFEDFIRKTEPLTPEQERLSLHVPPGFEVQLVASEPEIGKPINMAFDARGRLWLTQSREYPYAAPLDKPGRDKIKILSNFDENGRAGKVSTFAEGLNIPIGLYPYRNGVIAFSIPNIYFLQDTDGDGQADKKELILGRFGFDRDVHGLTGAFRRGFDGWLYADHGFNNNSTLTAKDGSTITMNSGNCYRFKIDGARVEQHSRGQVNPFGLMFDPLGDLWSADCHSSPVYQLLRGAYYPSFGKPNDGLGFGPDICKHSHGSTAIAGMVYYAAENFPAEYRGNTFVGNVMTCRINRDSLVQHGSTRVAKEEPDFLSSDDPWFRPVDLQLGPDGAIYIADFYNRIIGHYEVALDHPGRDRERGRIWRIIHRGTNAPRDFDLSRAKMPELLQELGDSNITRRMLAMNYLVDVTGSSAIDPVKKMMRDKKSNPFQKMHGLWVLHRLGALDEKALSAAATDKDGGVRVHAMKVLSETETWTPGDRKLALQGLADPDPYGQRAAADAVGRHPAPAHIRPLIELRGRVPAEDAQLLHVVRMALRDQLVPGENLARLRNSSLNETDSRVIADVCLGIKSSEAGQYLLKHVQTFSETREQLTAYLQHAARFAPETEMGQLARFTRTKFAQDVDFQLALFKSLQEGTRQRGAAVPPELTDWGAELARQLLDSVDLAALEWRNSPVKGSETANPWFLQERASADGDKASPFISSLPGGEKLTGLLRSKPFRLPAKLSFFLAGHDRPPGKPLGKNNFVRLLDATTHAVLAQTAPPRNDLAQPFTWDLTAHSGQEGYLEIADGNTDSAYAWLAIGRFDPPIISVPKLSPNQVDKRQLAAAELAGALQLTNLVPRLADLMNNSQADVDARSAAAKPLSTLGRRDQENSIAKIISDPEEPMKLRGKIAEVLGEMNSNPARAILVESLAAAPTSLQKELGLALASNSEGAEALLQAVADGKVSARVLQERNIKDRLTASKPADVSERIEKLTAHLPPASEERQKLIDERRARFNRAEASAAQGALAFKQYCAVCHTLDGQGALIGPQLDGVGGRGVDRLMEDILDPSRNVDRAFRTTLLILKDGDVQSGLFRRDEGEMLVLAASTGKEISVAKKDVQERRESETSIMPDNFSDVIPLEEFNNLVAFLLSRNSKPTVHR